MTAGATITRECLAGDNASTLVSTVTTFLFRPGGVTAEEAPEHPTACTAYAEIFSTDGRLLNKTDTGCLVEALAGGYVKVNEAAAYCTHQQDYSIVYYNITDQSGAWPDELGYTQSSYVTCP